MVSQTQTKGLQRAHSRGLLLSILEKKTILTRIIVLNDGRFSTETKDWNTYWRPVNELGQEKVEESINTLFSTWQDYVGSKFDTPQRQQFCYHYFSLLNNLLSLQNKFSVQIWLRALQTTLGFECFAIASTTNGDEVFAAGTCTLLNPCYLLAKIKMPMMLDDPQFLPVITTGSTMEHELFYHYRQYTISQDSPISLLLYPRVSLNKRLESFKLISSFVVRFSDGIDPRTNERAQRLFQGVIQPILKVNEISRKAIGSIEMIDVGAGSGSL